MIIKAGKKSCFFKNYLGKDQYTSYTLLWGGEKIKKFECVMQNNMKDCGVAALLTIIRTNGGDVPYEYLLKPLQMEQMLIIY